MRNVFIIGAGFSYAIAELPKNDNFMFRCSTYIRKNALFLREALNLIFPGGAVEEQWERMELEHVWTEIMHRYRDTHERLSPQMRKMLSNINNSSILEQYNKYLQNEGKESSKRFFMCAEWELKDLILSYLGLSFNNDITSRVLRELDKRGFQKGNTPDYIINFNYDTLIEQSLECYYLGLEDRNIQNGIGIPMCKPHGSLNWSSSLIGMLYKIENHRVERGLEGKHIKDVWIIPAVETKNTFIEQSYQLRRFSDDILGQFKRVLLDNINNVVILGYSFPVADKGVKDILFEVKKAMEEDNRRFDNIMWVVKEKEDRRQDLGDKIKEFFAVSEDKIDINLNGL